MTTKRSVENELNNVADRLLADLDSEKRLRMTPEAWSESDEDRLNRLHGTVPMIEGRFSDPSFFRLRRIVDMLAMFAARVLEVVVWKFYRAKTDERLKDAQWYAWADSAENDSEEWAWVEEPTPENGFHEGFTMETAARFYVDYHVYSRFAEEQLHVSREEFLTPAFPPGDKSTIQLIDDVAKLVDERMVEKLDEERGEGEREDKDDEGRDYSGWAGGVTFDYRGEERDAWEAAEIEYAGLIETWVKTAGAGLEGGK